MRDLKTEYLSNLVSNREKLLSSQALLTTDQLLHLLHERDEILGILKELLKETSNQSKMVDLPARDL